MLKMDRQTVINKLRELDADFTEEVASLCKNAALLNRLKTRIIYNKLSA